MQPDDYHKQWAHGVVSADACDVDTKRKLFENRTKAADIAMEKGFRGCAVVPHAYRLSDLGERMYAEHVDRDEEGNPIVGKWVWLRNSSHELECATSELVSWEPHYHIIGPTSPNMTGAKESDEWRYSVIRFNEHDLNGIATSDDSHEELFGTFRYIASHIAFPEDTDRQLITWHGELANSVFVEDAIEEWQVQKPSQGAREAIKRRMKGLAGPMVDNDDSDGDDNESDDLGECPTDDCDGRLIAVWDINAYLDHADPPPDVVHRMRVARDWVAGDLEPPGGLKHPTCEQDARQVLNHLL